MKIKILLAAALLLGVAVSKADAQSINAKARHERGRITNGVRSGELTRPEAYRLGQEQRGIRRDMHRYRSNDGRIGPRERKQLRREERRHSRHIFRAKHNRHHRHF